LTNGRRISVKLFLAEAGAKGRRESILVTELSTPTFILGIYALETLGFRANPVTWEPKEISLGGEYLS